MGEVKEDRASLLAKKVERKKEAEVEKENNGNPTLK